MRVFKPIFWILFLLLFLTIHSACKQDAPENPCLKSHKVTNDDLAVQETPFNDLYPDINKLFSRWIFYDSPDDSFISLNQGLHISLRNIKSIDSCKWYFNQYNYPEKNNKTSFNLDGSLVGQLGWKIKARCIVYRKPDKFCFPNDDGIDTLNKTINFKYITSYCKLLVNGSFYGFFEDSPGKIDTISIDLCNKPPTGSHAYTKFVNFLPKTTQYLRNVDRFGEREIAFAYNEVYWNTLIGIAFMIDDDHIFLDYQYTDDNGIIHLKKFNGSRVK